MYSWKKSTLKGLQSIAEAALAAALAAGAMYMLSALDTKEELEALAVPAAYIVPILFAVRMGINWLKNRNLGK
jgi:hypothetical protein